MSNDNRDRPRAAAPLLEPIRVRELWFFMPGGPPLPMSNSGGGRGKIAAREKEGTRITIQFEPWLRHHRVREVVHGKLKVEFCIPESAVVYVPEDQPAEPEPERKA
ncbi:MAG: hypothetical protein ABR520_11220 [Mycobacteriales bacterium]|nr:hypothetical protein [Actinomycetota bacterium]